MAKRPPKSSAGRAGTAKKTNKKAKPRKRKARPVVVFPTAPVRLPLPPKNALALYQRGMTALQQHKYGKASEAFTSLLERFPDELALLDRARLYLELCRRSLETSAPGPQTAEEKLTAATAALNEGDNTRAESLSKSVLADAPESDMALYLLATVEMRREKTDTALAYLADAVAISAEAGAQALHDTDFAPLRDNEAFRKLTRPPAPSGGRGSR